MPETNTSLPAFEENSKPIQMQILIYFLQQQTY